MGRRVLILNLRSYSELWSQNLRGGWNTEFGLQPGHWPLSDPWTGDVSLKIPTTMVRKGTSGAREHRQSSLRGKIKEPVVGSDNACRSWIEAGATSRAAQAWGGVSVGGRGALVWSPLLEEHPAGAFLVRSGPECRVGLTRRTRLFPCVA